MITLDGFGRIVPEGRGDPFRQAPVIDDDGFVAAESAAVVLYVAEKAGVDPFPRTRADIR